MSSSVTDVTQNLLIGSTPFLHKNKEIRLHQKNLARKQSSSKTSSKNKKDAIKSIKITKRELRKKFDLQCIGVGVGGDYESLGLEFYYYKPLTQDEARNMVLSCAEVFGVNINESRKIEDQSDSTVEKYPAAITIYSMDKNYIPSSDPFICVVCFHSKGIEYLTKEMNQKFGYKNTFTETLEEAEFKNQEYLRQLQEKRQSES